MMVAVVRKRRSREAEQVGSRVYIKEVVAKWLMSLGCGGDLKARPDHVRHHEENEACWIWNSYRVDA
jgi:hypothetical protein